MVFISYDYKHPNKAASKGPSSWTLGFPLSYKCFPAKLLPIVLMKSQLHILFPRLTVK